MNGILDKAVERFKAHAEEEREELKTLLVNFRNLYGFLSQVIPYQDSDLEQLYTYLRFLLTKLPRRNTGPGYDFGEEVELQYYRLQKISEGQIALNTGEGSPLKGPGDVGTGEDDKEVRLSELIDILNERFGTDFTQADQLFFDQIQEEALESETLRKAAAANSKEDFRYVFEKAFEGLVIDRMDGNEDIFNKLMSDGEFRKLALEHLLHKVYAASGGQYPCRQVDAMTSSFTLCGTRDEAEELHTGAAPRSICPSFPSAAARLSNWRAATSTRACMPTRLTSPTATGSSS